MFSQTGLSMFDLYFVTLAKGGMEPVIRLR